MKQDMPKDLKRIQIAAIMATMVLLAMIACGTGQLAKKDAALRYVEFKEASDAISKSRIRIRVNQNVW